MIAQPVSASGSTPREIRIAIVGCGALTQLFYAPALKCIATKRPVRVVALIDPVPDRVDAIARHFPDSIRGADLAAIPDDTDLAIVASPPGFHAAQTIALVERGFHVLCEKPMAGRVEECDAMIAAARRAGRLLTVGHFKRFFAATRCIKELVDGRALGRLRAIRFVEGGKFGWPAQSRALFERRSGQGGVLIDIGAHAFDLMAWWFGEPTIIACRDDAMGGVEANVWVRLAFADGVEGELGMSRDWDVPNRYFIRFEHGWVAWDPVDANHLELGWGNRYALKASVHEVRRAFGQPHAGAIAPTRHQAFIEQIENVMDAIEGTAPPMVSAEDGRRVIALIEQCYARSTLIDMPWMSPAEWNRGNELRCTRSAS